MLSVIRPYTLNSQFLGLGAAGFVVDRALVAAASLDSGIVKSQPGNDVSQAEQDTLHQLVNLQRQLGGLTAENEPARGQGFQFKNVTMRDDLGLVRMKGEVTNGSGQSYSVANFTITLYDKKGDLITSGVANVSNLAKGDTKTFDVPIAGVTTKQIARYTIQFDNGW
jgi:hypothetical protein